MSEDTANMSQETGGFSRRELILGVLSFLLIVTVLTIGVELIGIQRLQAAIEDAGPVAPLLYILLKAATYIFAPLSSGPIQLSSGLLFGLVPGVFYTLIGEVLGGSVSFWIARLLGRPAVQRFVGKDGIKRVDRFHESYLGGWQALAYARLFLFAIYDFLSYAIGLTKTRFLTYVWVSTFFGAIPTALFVGVGTLLAQDRSLLIAAYAGVGILSALPLLFRKQLNRLLKRKPQNK